jgi:hypothetical protein
MIARLLRVFLYRGALRGCWQGSRKYSMFVIIMSIFLFIVALISFRELTSTYTRWWLSSVAI